MRLHYHPMSPYARKTQVAVLHREDDVELAMIDIRGGGLRTEAYQAMSPFGKMPVLETEAGPIIESTSIIDFLESRGPAKLIPEGDAGRRARHWDRIGDLYLIDSQTKIWFQPGSDDAEQAEKYALSAWTQLDKALADRSFLVGDDFTLADLGPSIGSDYLVRLGLEPPTNVAAWVKRCFEIPAMAAAIAEAQPMVEGTLAARAEKIANR